MTTGDTFHFTINFDFFTKVVTLVTFFIKVVTLLVTDKVLILLYYKEVSPVSPVFFVFPNKEFFFNTFCIFGKKIEPFDSTNFFNYLFYEIEFIVFQFIATVLNLLPSNLTCKVFLSESVFKYPLLCQELKMLL